MLYRNNKYRCTEILYIYNIFKHTLIRKNTQMTHTILEKLKRFYITLVKAQMKVARRRIKQYRSAGYVA